MPRATLAPLFVTRAQLKGFFAFRKQARKDAAQGRSLAMRISARDAYRVMGMRIRAELSAGARFRLMPMDEVTAAMVEGRFIAPAGAGNAPSNAGHAIPFATHSAALAYVSNGEPVIECIRIPMNRNAITFSPADRGLVNANLSAGADAYLYKVMIGTRVLGYVYTLAYGKESDVFDAYAIRHSDIRPGCNQLQFPSQVA